MKLRATWRCLDCDETGEGDWNDVDKAAARHTKNGHNTTADALTDAVIAHMTGAGWTKITLDRLQAWQAAAITRAAQDAIAEEEP